MVAATVNIVAACPSEEVVAALVHCALPDDEAETFRGHIDVCESCAELLAAIVRGRTIGEPPRAGDWPRS